MDEAPRLVAALAENGWQVGSVYGQWRETTFRIGHLGEVAEADLEALLEAVDRRLSRGNGASGEGDDHG